MARVGLLRRQTIPLGVTLTLGAFVPLAEADIEQMLKTSLVGWELLEEPAYICLFHAFNIGKALPYVKGIHPTVAFKCRLQHVKTTIAIDIDIDS